MDAGYRVRTPDAAPDEAEDVELPVTIVTHRRVEVNPKAYSAWRPNLCGHAVLGGAAKLENV
ncbi:MAG: hypothetical protein H8E44_01985 [Planctomycetes bacterium]|nr:hypothetical protein [Planctomycetota bacterium]MBL7042163.1 hypothetical protein [Pirellulaceae bacterium]